ncbi:hypothetical protein KOW79_017336 [Hemibagrus wyckioides]|uniref:Uncharacterized protein n=1 Tax=Hemibagrus wyckioides TaxID=337641 RepID=A0A9D3SCC7_9TELE|nr:hypothetical protein KOW79_017336 [Hemibagrus wyckioides]
MTCFTAFPRWQTTLHPRDEPWLMRADQEFLRSVHARSSQVRDASRGSPECMCEREEVLRSSGFWHPTADRAYAWCRLDAGQNPIEKISATGAVLKATTELSVINCLVVSTFSQPLFPQISDVAKL